MKIKIIMKMKMKHPIEISRFGFIFSENFISDLSFSYCFSESSFSIVY